MNSYTITITRNGAVHESLEVQASAEVVALRGVQMSREVRNIHRDGDRYNVLALVPEQEDGLALAAASMYEMNPGFAAYVDDALAGLRPL